MKQLLTLLIILCFSIASAQNTPALPLEKSEIYFQKLADHIYIPDEILQQIETEEIELKVSMSINSDGTLSNIRIGDDKNNLQPYLQKALTELPHWKPRKVDGRPVYSKKNFTLFIPNKKQEDRKAIAPFTKQEFYKEFSDRMSMIYDFKILEQDIKRFDVKISFTVDEEGLVKNVKTLPIPTTRAMKKMEGIFTRFGKWKPAISQGKPVSSQEMISIPISVNIPVS